MALPILSLGLFLVPNVSSAQTFCTGISAYCVAQTSSYATLSTGITGGTYIQALGTGISGYPVTFQFYGSEATSGNFQYVFWECTTANYAAGTCVNKYISGNAVQAGSMTGAGQILRTVDVATTSWQFDSTKYYAFQFEIPGMNIYGSNSSSSLPRTDPYGFGSGGLGGAAGQPSSNKMGNDAVKQMYFAFVSTASSVTSYPGLSNLQPANGSTTVSTTVNLSFQYNATNISGLGYQFLLIDRTTGSSESLIGLLGATSGTISRVKTLISGHQYKLSAAITDTSGGTYGGLSSIFSVVATGTPLVQYAASSTIYYDPQGNIITGSGAFATSSLYYQGNSFSLSGLLPTELQSALSTRFPFSYVYDMLVLFEELGGGTATTTNAQFTFPLGAQTSTGSTTFIMIDKNAIASIPAVASIREMITNVLYVTTAIVIIGAVMGAF